MKEQTQALEHASVKQYCKALRVPMIGAHFVQLAEQAGATGTPFSNVCATRSCHV
jgi:hypothetical protein